MIYIYTKFQLIVFTISNIALIVWILYGLIKLNNYLKDILGINDLLNK